jgi:hypothetical protein
MMGNHQTMPRGKYEVEENFITKYIFYNKIIY